MECKFCNLTSDKWYRTTKDFGIVELEQDVLTAFYKQHGVPSSIVITNMEHALRQISDREFGNGNYTINKPKSKHYHINAIFM